MVGVGVGVVRGPKTVIVQYPNSSIGFNAGAGNVPTMEKVTVPTTVGVPVMAPVTAFKSRP
jgi:hypothetical protein